MLNNEVPLVSIIMPVYNTGNYLRRAIESIINQTYNNFELLLIDDGSDDGSGNVCDEYASSFSNIIAYHKENGGICDARNYGLKRAKGKYIAFCDHDDKYRPMLLSTVIGLAEKYKCDIVNYKSCLVAGNDISGRSGSESGFFYSETNFNGSLLLLLCNNCHATVWSNIYRSDLLRENKVLFDTSFKHGGEDFDFNLEVYKHIHSIYVSNQVLYVHYLHEESSTSAKFYSDMYFQKIKEINKANLLINYRNVDYNHNKYYYTNYFFSCIFSALYYGLHLNKTNEDQIILLKKFKDNFLLKNSSINPLIYVLKNHTFGHRMFYAIFIRSFLKSKYSYFYWKYLLLKK